MLERDTKLGSDGRYVVVRSISHGNMGMVYLGKNVHVGYDVAIKESLYPTEQLLAIFKHEVELLAQLQHRALPRILDHFGDEHGRYYIIMEYVPGNDLATKLKEQGPFEIDEVLGWADTILEVLVYVHAQGVVHRDIKPANLKLTPRDELYLLDFGIAKGTQTLLPNATLSAFRGAHTPFYAPPEQISGQGTDQRSDLYALGATMYHLLVGTPALSAEKRNKARSDPLLFTDLYTIPPPVAKVIEKALRLEREDRFLTAHEMRSALRDAVRKWREAARARAQDLGAQQPSPPPRPEPSPAQTPAGPPT